MELEYRNADEIKVESPLVGKVGFKQNTAPIICFVFGIALMFVNGIMAKVLGAFFVLMAMFVLRFVKDKRTMDVYETGVVVYHSKKEDLAFYIDYNDIRQWKISRDSGHDSVVFEFKDKQSTGIDTFQIEKAYNLLMKACPKKEEREIQREKNKQLKFANPIDTLRNLGKKLTKKK